MLKSIISFLGRTIKLPDIRKKVILTAVILLVFRLVAHIPVAGINRTNLQVLFAGSPLLSLLDVFSGGTLANFSIMALGLNPYINASIILQLLQYVIPSLEELQREGEYGQEKINQYTRFLTVPLAAFQAFVMYSLLRSQGIVGVLSPLALGSMVISMTAGTVFAVWLGELITQYGFSNGVSILIFTGIVARMPISLAQSVSVFQSEDLLKTLVVLALAIVVVGLIVFMNEATRQVPISYSRKRSGFSSGAASYLPLRLNQAGVIPIIFAVSLVLLPSFISQYLSSVSNPTLAGIARAMGNHFQPQSVLYNLVYFLLVVGFTYFYTDVVFNPEKISENLQKNGGFVPGIRPGSQTTHYLAFVLNRVTLVGAVFLGLVAILPSLFQNMIGTTNLAIGGTGILIVVSVVLEITRELEAQIVMKRYDAFVHERSF